MDVARATSSPMRSSMRRSTPGIGDGTQGSRAAWTATRREKSALISMLCPPECQVLYFQSLAECTAERSPDRCEPAPVAQRWAAGKPFGEPLSCSLVAPGAQARHDIGVFEQLA